ncbi:hypothetical protein [Syntrophomonas palmitatica]|nr:hypothetical protein [Syntrophomonas palmitatica]
MQARRSRGAAPQRLRRLRLVLPGADALRPHRRLHVRGAAAQT